MAFTINTNIQSLQAQMNLNNTAKSLNQATERLSSGLKINSAKDDAANQAIANRMMSQINGLKQASSNASDGISLAQTTEGALDQINDNLQKIRTLTVQALNGTNSSSDLASIQDEINQRVEEIGRISDTTTFNGTDVLDGNSGSINIGIQVGANDGERININFDGITFGGNAVDGYTSVTLGGVNLSSLAVGVANIGGTGSITMASQISSTILGTIDDAVNEVGTMRSQLGALQNRFESAIDNITTTTTNLTEAHSRIMDADYAEEVSNLSKAQIIQQAGTSVLAQANQSSQGVLSLLQ